MPDFTATGRQYGGLEGGRRDGLDSQTLETLGQRLGFKVQARGMSSYEFSGQGLVFFVFAHNDISAKITRADESVILSRPVKRGADIVVKIPIKEGMSMSKIEQYFTDFIVTAKVK